MDLDVDTTQTTINCISFCSGIRGIERGLERVVPNLRTLCHVEIEAFIIENLVAEMEQGLVAPAPIWSNIKTFDPKPFRGRVHIITGGYPCQPFSNAGKRKGTEDPRHLWPYIENAVDTIRPDVCFFENVRGHVNLGLREVIESLEGLGYRVHWGIFSAEETDASHKRERVFIMAVRRELVDPNNGSVNNLTRRHEEKSDREELQQWDKNKKSCQSNQWDNTSGHGFESHDSIPTRRNSTEIASSTEMGNSTEQGFQKPGQRRVGELQEESGEGIYDRPQKSGSHVVLADMLSEGLEGYTGNEQREGRQRVGQDRPITKSGIPQSVARPGQPQHEWECPRATNGQWETKSSMGGPINGYKFREDFLRALGNSVYSESAALAWKTLSKKHGLKI